MRVLYRTLVTTDFVAKSVWFSQLERQFFRNKAYGSLIQDYLIASMLFL